MEMSFDFNPYYPKQLLSPSVSSYRHNRWVFIAFAISILFLAYAIDRSNFGQVVLGYALAFYAYYYWIEKRHFRTAKAIFSQALIIRLLLLLAVPKLSDDYFRFIWDGLIQVNGLNPFASLPSEVEGTSDYMQGLMDQMNSPDYYSVYPPIMQGVFYAISALVGENTMAQLIAMRVILIAADMGVIWVGIKILRMLKRPISNVSLYALNPLVIVELIGNLHFEGLMLFFTLSGIYFLMRMLKESKAWLVLPGTVLIASGVLTKIVLLLSLPALWRRWGAPKTAGIGILTLVFCVAGFALYVDIPMIHHMGQSLDLYFRNFEFNASIYSLTRTIAYEWIPYYTSAAIGPYVTGVMILGILSLTFLRKAERFEGFFETLLFILSVYLLFASTVHPWYIVNLVAVSLFTQYRYPIVWSFVVVVSYFMYANDLIEVGWMIGLEYLVVLGYFIYEMKNIRSNRIHDQ
ncbi:MAG: polyprenol phosphomannose-dependent alpha 1,6 mannosyltransferase MptB [Flavobacteriales bacterium]|nr:polyprenol phosphomannose-dependent alpha 1,6 mannosyltransferase MptB [Flavobacteriales bacterium]